MLIVCLEARKDLMISRGDETSLVEANTCIRKIDSYSQSVSRIFKAYYQNRVVVNPCEFYDRHDSSKPMEIKLLNDEMGFYSYFQESVDRYNSHRTANNRINYSEYEDLQFLTEQQRRAVAQEWFTRNFYGGEYSGSGNLTFNALANVSASNFAVGADNNIIIGSGFAIGTPANAVNQSGMIFNGNTPATQVTIVAN